MYKLRRKPGTYRTAKQADNFAPYPPHRWDVKNYQVFTDFENVVKSENGIRIFSKRQMTDEIPAWVRKQRELHFGSCPAYTHTSGKLFSKWTIRPPFRISALCTMPQQYGHVPSIWLRNDLQMITREIDLFETTTESVFFTGHVGFHNYEQTKFKATRVYTHTKGYQHIDVEVLADRVDWWYNGVHVKRMRADWDYEYYLIVSLGVTHPDAGVCTFDVHNLTVMT